MVKTFPSSTGGSRFDPWSIPGSERSAREGIGTSILHTPVFLGFPCGSTGKESACNAGDLGSIPGSGRFPWRGERLPTPVFRPGEFHGLYSPWAHKEQDMTERPSLSLEELRSLGQETKTENRSNIVTNSIKTLKMVHIKKKNLKKTTTVGIKEKEISC